MPVPNPGTRRDHRGGAVPTTLVTAITPSDALFTIAAWTGWPTSGVGPFFVVIDPGTVLEEKLLLQSQASGVCTVAGGGRGVDGTTAKTHASGAVIYPVWTATEADEANEHLASVSGVHGVAGDVVGTTDAQVLTNKTIDVASNTLDPTLTALAGLSATPGLLAQTGADTFAKRTLTSGDAALVITNGDGVAGNPTLSINEAALTGVDADKIDGKTVTVSAVAPSSPAVGDIWINTSGS